MTVGFSSAEMFHYSSISRFKPNNWSKSSFRSYPNCFKVFFLDLPSFSSSVSSSGPARGRSRNGSTSTASLSSHAWWAADHSRRMSELVLVPLSDLTRMALVVSHRGRSSSSSACRWRRPSSPPTPRTEWTAANAGSHTWSRKDLRVLVSKK